MTNMWILLPCSLTTTQSTSSFDKCSLDISFIDSMIFEGLFILQISQFSIFCVDVWSQEFSYPNHEQSTNRKTISIRLNSRHLMTGASSYIRPCIASFAPASKDLCNQISQTRSRSRDNQLLKNGPEVSRTNFSNSHMEAPNHLSYEFIAIWRSRKISYPSKRKQCSY